MASTYSTNLAIELIGTGDQAGTWGTTTNSNLGTLIEQSISGYVTQAVSTGTDTTITIPNGSTGVARNMYIELTGTGGASTNLIVPANKKLYFIFNNSTGAVTVKVSGQTGVSVPTGKKMVLVSNGTDIVNGLNYIADFASNIATFAAGSAAAPSITTTGDTNTGIFFPAADTIAFTEGGVESMRIDSSGNLGLGVTPSNALNTTKSFEMAYSGAVYGKTGTNETGIVNNYYQNSGGTVLYKNNGYAASYVLGDSGNHAWYIAASGTVSGTVSLTQAMTLDASGKLGIGTTSPAEKLDVVGNCKISSGNSFYWGDATSQITATNSGPMLFLTGTAVERARILSGGNFIVGGTSAVEGGLFVTSFDGATVPGVVIADTSATGTANMLFFYKSGAVRGSIQTTASATAYNTSSDRRLKDNIAPADNAGSVIDAIEVVKHDWKVGGHTRYGMIAQDLHIVAPEAVSVGDDGEELKTPWGVDYSKLVPMMMKELQSLRKRVAELESK